MATKWLLEQHKHTLPSGNTAAQDKPMRGANGLWGTCLERDTISTLIQPMGVADYLPVKFTNYEEAFYPYLTGHTLTVTGSQPATWDACTDPQKVVGAVTICRQFQPWGYKKYLTPEVNVSSLGALRSRCEFADQRFVNSPTARLMGRDVAKSYFPSIDQMTDQVFLGSEILRAFYDVGKQFQLILGKEIWTGNHGGTANQMNGLDALIGTNKVDALTGDACNGLDSLILDATNKNVCTITDTDEIALLIDKLVFTLKTEAQQTGLWPLVGYLVMRPELFDQLAQYYASVYYNLTGATCDQYCQDIVNMRDQMRREKWLIVRGEKVPVLLDEGIEATTINGTTRSSTIYFVPFEVNGGNPVLEWHFWDMRTAINSGAGQLGANGARTLNSIMWSDDGKFQYGLVNNLYSCLQWWIASRYRLVLKTPQLAGKIINVYYCYNPVRNPYPTDIGYVAPVGITTAPAYTEPYHDTTP